MRSLRPFVSLQGPERIKWFKPRVEKECTCEHAVDDGGDVHEDTLVDPDGGHDALGPGLYLRSTAKGRFLATSPTFSLTSSSTSTCPPAPLHMLEFQPCSSSQSAMFTWGDKYTYWMPCTAPLAESTMKMMTMMTKMVVGML